MSKEKLILVKDLKTYGRKADSLLQSVEYILKRKL